ncbi:hypothetical protein QQZ08_003634 [Neonectria magnoliae]|uniref:Transcription factor domain-containing protein n=1 Tax=Neonectria magnoliae TaxID=2732573 RepID=A0ABR1I870_9HYPO
MAFAAIHLDAIGGLDDNAEKLIDTLQGNSITHLRHQLARRDPTARVVSLATTRTLCQAQIYGGKPLWRLHLNGARAILQSSHTRHDTQGSCSCASTEEGFLLSWYNNAEGLAALTPAGLPSGQLGISCPSSREVFFDIFGGVMSDLPDLFKEVGALVKERRRRVGPSSSHSILAESDIAVEADTLIREIHYRLQRDTAENLSLHPQILLTLSANDIEDYALGNAAFLYTALLHIHCGVQRKPSSGPEAQFCVQNIIYCAQNMNFSSGLSPRVLLVAPLFAAGLCAVGSGRESARSALVDIGSWMKTPHLSKTLTFLEQSWSQFNGGLEGDGVWAWFERISFDFLPY